MPAMRPAAPTPASRLKAGGPEGNVNEVRTLLLLQQLDLDIDATSAELEQLTHQLGDTPELTAAREAQAAAHAALDELRRSQRDLEYEVESLTAKIAGEDKQLYDNRGRGARELEGIRRSIESLKGNRRHAEDRILDVMTALESAQADAAAKDAECERVTAEWRSSQGGMVDRQDSQREHLQVVTARRQQHAAGIAPALLARYEDLRRLRRGRAVAIIERNTCQGCRITLPLIVVQHARAARELVPCPSCGRFLVSDR